MDNKIQKKFFIKENLFSPNQKLDNKGINSNIFTQRNIKSGNITQRSYNLELYNSNNKKRNNRQNPNKKSYFIINNNLRPLSNNKLMNKSRNQNIFRINNLSKYKTFINKNHTSKFRAHTNVEESNDSSYEERKDTEINTEKKIFINGRETTNYEKFCYDLLSSKLKKSKLENKKKKFSIKIKYNEKVFNRNNQVLIPSDQLKRQLTASSDIHDTITLKSLLNSISISKATINNKSKNFITKSKNEKILKKIINLNNELYGFKYYLITELINKEKNIGDKIIDIENKLNPHNKKKLIIKDILYEKLDNNKKESINNSSNKDQSLNELINNFEKNKTRKVAGFLEKKFIGEIRKMNNLNIKDLKMNSIFETKKNYYNWKQNIIQIEEEKMKQKRKNLSNNTKKMKTLVDSIYNIQRKK